jgi:outer membrane protein assembly factor BamD
MQFQLFRYFLVLVLSFVVACASEQTDPNNPEGVFQEAEQSLKDERYLIALEKFREVKNRFPYSKRAVDAELRIADTFFAQESYLEAESAYEIFRELHPTHPRIDYVQFQIGMSYYLMIPENSARDLSAAHRAIDAFELLEQRFPDSELAKQGREKIREARSRLAEHENYVADFYFRRQHYLSASYRYAALLREFQNSGFEEEALFRLGQCYYNTRMFENARDALNRLVKEHPTTGFRGSAQALLQNIEKKNE